MMVKVATVAIANEDGSDYIIINQVDYQPDVHIPWEGQSTQDESGLGLEHSVNQRAGELADLHTMTELKAMAKDLGVPRYSKMREDDLAVAIAQAEAERDDNN